ncbi:MAG: phosphosulfolactate synthase [Hyphomicrobiales bacterium]|nr:phosphosulfolactate synthase [Hyphomicrobiales bacterium]
MDKTVSAAPFAMVPLPAEREGKPRASGLTMMMDWGLGLARVEDHLGLVAPYVDLAKIVAGTGRLYPEDVLVRKLDLYKRFDVQPFLGGQFSEYVFATQGWDAMAPFFDEARRLGFTALEISDNCVPLDDAARSRLVRMAVACGLEVHGEVGSKLQMQSADELVRQAGVCFEAGCEVVLVEAAELMVDGKPHEALLAGLRRELDLSKVLFELTGPWISGVTHAGSYDLKTFLVAEFGPQVNLANVMPDDVLETEALRCGLSVIGPEV